MQGLFIANKVLSIIIILVMCFAIMILTLIYDKTKKDTNVKIEMLCKKYSKIFLSFLIISTILFAYIVTGYSLSIVLYDPEPDDTGFPLVSIFISAFCIIVFFSLYIIPKIRKKEKDENKSDTDKNAVNMVIKENDSKAAENFAEEQRQREEQETKKRIEWEMKRRIDEANRAAEVNRHVEEAKRHAADEQQKREREERQKEEQNKWLMYFKENSHSVVEKYAYTVENLINKLTNIYDNLFLEMFNQTIIPMSSILVYPYKNLQLYFLRDAIGRDGLKFDQSQNEEINKKLQNVITLYVEKLKEEIQSNNEWANENTLPLLIYKVIRNNIIKHYHDKYVLECGYENLEELCKNIPEPIEEKEIISYSTGNKISKKILLANKKAAVWFIYYYIYENDVNLPFVETYKKLCSEMKNIVANQEVEKIKNELFGGRKVKVETSKNAGCDISPIEKIDKMTGGEFEVFMTQYFASHGFKATHTPLSGDYGIDLILENDFVKIGVQAKCYSNKVSSSAIQEVVAGLRHYGLSSGMVITNNYFQPSAIQLAKENNITLWDRNKLIEKLGE